MVIFIHHYQTNKLTNWQE